MTVSLNKALFKQKLELYFNNGIECLSTKDYFSAIKYFSLCIKINSKDSLSYFKRAKALKSIKRELDIYKSDFDFQVPRKTKVVFGITFPEHYLTEDRHLYYLNLESRQELRELDYNQEIERNINHALELDPKNLEYHLFKINFDSTDQRENAHFRLMSAIECIEILPDNLNEINLSIKETLRYIDFTHRKTEFDISFRAALIDTIASLSAATKCEPDNPDNYFKRAIVKINLYLPIKKLHESALQDFEKVIETNSNNHKALNNKGVELVYLDEFSEAITYFTKAIELEPEQSIYYNNRGLALFNLREFELANNDLSLSIEIKPDVHAYVNRGNLRRFCSDFEGAQNDYNAAEIIMPSIFIMKSEFGDGEDSYMDPMLGGEYISKNCVLVS